MTKKIKTDPIIEELFRKLAELHKDHSPRLRASVAKFARSYWAENRGEELRGLLDDPDRLFEAHEDWCAGELVKIIHARELPVVLEPSFKGARLSINFPLLGARVDGQIVCRACLSASELDAAIKSPEDLAIGDNPSCSRCGKRPKLISLGLRRRAKYGDTEEG